MKRPLLSVLFIAALGSAHAQDLSQDSVTIRQFSNEIMLHGTCYDNLRVLCKQVGKRLSGSPAAAKAVEWGQKAMEATGADKVWLQPVKVPHWVRGKESMQLKFGAKGTYIDVPMLSIGNSIGSDGKILEANVLMVKDLDAFKALSDQELKGKIIFFNYRFRQDYINTFQGYGDAGKYRWMAPEMAAQRGVAGVIIRSLSTGIDDFPHTGAMRYPADTVKHVPSIAIGNKTADMLEEKCMKGLVSARIQSECQMRDSVMSYNVIGEIKGSEYPEEIIVVGGHLDSWDVGEGASDDGTGCVQSIEVLRAFKALQMRPKRTIRAVLFMNEENGIRGGVAYADSAKTHNENHILAIETDAGGFSPRGIGMEMTDAQRRKIRFFAPLFLPYGVYDFSHHEGGSDIGPLGKQHVPLAGLMPDQQRYFDLHHTNNDVFEQVNHRELKIGATTLTALVYLISQYGMK
ncbi:MAG: M20/M25/M40 family metallo-hydrolase [Bacteroidota bacterium]